jgi:hypothetical protein
MFWSWMTVTDVPRKAVRCHDILGLERDGCAGSNAPHVSKKTMELYLQTVPFQGLRNLILERQLAPCRSCECYRCSHSFSMKAILYISALWYWYIVVYIIYWLALRPIPIQNLSLDSDKITWRPAGSAQSLPMQGIAAEGEVHIYPCYPCNSRGGP